LYFALASTGLAQRGGRGGAAATNNAEANEFQDLLDETNALRRVSLAEAFIDAHKLSTYRPQVDQILVDQYTRNQDWARVIATAERLQRELSGARAQTKAPILTSAILAALRVNDLPRAMQFGDWIVTGDPGDINPYQILSSAIPERLPQDPAQRTAALNKALDYATKGLMLQKPPRVSEADWTAAQIKLRLAVAFIHLNMDQFLQAATEYEAALKPSPKDAIAQFRMGIAYFLATQSQGQAFTTAVKAVADAVAAKADAAGIKELENKRDALAIDIAGWRDHAVDALARSVAIGMATNNPVTQPARQQLEPLFRNQMPDAPAGALDKLIAEKKTELGL
jgi:tetratricopeptide (TPR) repeat protein